MFHARRFHLFISVCLVLLLGLGTGAGSASTPHSPAASVGTAFTYQGTLYDGGTPANGTYDFQFGLYDASSGGAQVGSTLNKGDVTVSDGQFTVELDFGPVFDGTALWLEVAVRPGSSTGSYTTLSPRQALTAAPYAVYALNIPDHNHWGASWSGSGTGLTLSGGSIGLDSSGTNYGVYGASASTAGTGVVGLASATSGITYGVFGLSDSTAGYGVYGRASATSGTTYGVLGQSYSTAGYGVYGYATATSGTAHGVYGRSDSTAGRGVFGLASATSGTTYGMYGQSYSTAGRGVFGLASATSGPALGMYGASASTAGTGVFGLASATSGTTYGMYGQSYSTAGTGVFGWASATSGFTYGVLGQSASTAGMGVFGYASAASGTNYGVYGYSSSTIGYGGYFYGDVHVLGDLSATGAKAFKIDHPLDPANRYLYHFAQESPEVQNVYNGVVILDAKGEATVMLPEYFATLNTGPYRYQLTPIGAPMPNLYIAQEIQGNTFRIAGGAPGKEVSWEVTAVRNDPYLRDHPVQAEVDKSADEKGTYLYPQGYGQPETLGLDYQRNAELLNVPDGQ